MTGALRAIGAYVERPEFWDVMDEYEIGSCWLNDEPGTQVSFRAQLVRETEEWKDGRFFRSTKTQVPLTARRLCLATGIEISS